MFHKSVFINCPFDDKYIELLRPLLFTVLYLDMIPRIALERLDAGEARFSKIVELIGACKYGIHDLSRAKAQKRGEYYRMNMPFELGLDIGAKLFGEVQFSDKITLILEEERYRHQATISDLSNADIAVHGNEPEEVVKVVRDWLSHAANLRADGPSAIWGAFIEFMAHNYDALKQRGYSDKDIGRVPIPELIENMSIWTAGRRR
ncbi:hypothetical protein [Pararhizobium sp. LjRoot238]|uniref:hypothetical protein n=1 Tax=Pararhizobium sp. LjRoot238 TaxID=3342293 RepID=UPI003ED04163